MMIPRSQRSAHERFLREMRSLLRRMPGACMLPRIFRKHMTFRPEEVVDLHELFGAESLGQLEVGIDPRGIHPAESRVPERESRWDTSVVIAYERPGRSAFIRPTPLVMAPMDTVCDPAAAIKFWHLGGVGCVHRNYRFPDDTDTTYYHRMQGYYRMVANAGAQAFWSVGINDFDLVAALDRTRSEMGHEHLLILIEVANGGSAHVIDFAQALREKYPHMVLMVGNVASERTAVALARVGVDVIRMGIGGGSGCGTPGVTGVKAANFTAFTKIRRALREADLLAPDRKDGYGAITCADGFARQFGDFAVVLTVSDLAMAGRHWAQTWESPYPPQELWDGKRTPVLCETVFGQEEWCTPYRGMASDDVKKSLRAGKAGTVPAGGVTRFIPLVGTLSGIFKKTMGAIREAMTYGIDEFTLADLQANARLVMISPGEARQRDPIPDTFRPKGERRVATLPPADEECMAFLEQYRPETHAFLRDQQVEAA